MTVTFNAFEVFEIAEQIERNGINFYIRTAELFDDPKTIELFLRLAEWERQHEQIFARMKDQLSEQDRKQSALEPDDLMPNPGVMAGLAVFGIRSDPAKELHGKQNRIDILRRAVEKEKDSIVFYLGIKEAVDESLGQGRIDHIIKEEMGHIKLLSAKLVQYKA